MKNVKLFEEFGENFHDRISEENYKFLEQGVEGTWEINDSGLVDVKGSFRLGREALNSSYLVFKKLPIKFGYISAIFSVSGSYLETLEGCPIEVGKHFSVSNCASLKTLEFSPRIVHGDVYAYSCRNLESLEGGPEEVGGDYDIDLCKNLKSLKGFPYKFGGSFEYRDCPLIPEEELRLMENEPKMFYAWMKSKLSFEEFKHEKRGAFAAKKFGF